MDKQFYRLDEIGKAILLGLYRSGKTKTFSQLLTEADFTHDNARQVEIAISLETLELIQSVSYKLPLEIHAELSPLGHLVVESLHKTKESKLKKIIENAKRHLHGGGYDFQMTQ